MTLSVIKGSLCFSQSVGINPTGNLPNQTAGLDIDFPNKGVLVPRMVAAVRLAIVNPANALLVFDTDSNCFFFYTSVPAKWNSLCNLPGAVGATGPTGPSGGPPGPTGPTGVSSTTVLFSDFVSSANISNSSEQVLKTWTMPANTLNNNGTGINIEVFGRGNFTLTSAQIKLKIANDTLFIRPPITTSGKWEFDINSNFYITSVGNQKSVGWWNSEIVAPTDVNIFNHTLNMSSALQISITAQNQAAIANSLIIEGFIIRKIE